MRLRWRLSDGRSGEVETSRRIVTIGADSANDVCIPGARLAAQHAHLLVRTDGVLLSSLGGHTLAVNGRRVSGDARIQPDDRLSIGDLEIEILLDPAPELETRGEASGADVLDRLLWFTRALAEIPSPVKLLDTLLDLLMAVLEADRGMVVVGDVSTPRVVAARGVDGVAAQQDLLHLPDRLLAKVYATGRPIVTIDAQNDVEMAGSTSVARLGLQAVLVLPLSVARAVSGVLFLASGRPGPRFTRAGLAEVSLYAAQASLLVDQVERVGRLAEELADARSALEDLGTGDVLCASAGMAQVMQLVQRLAPSDLSVLLIGETGTGKEVIARELHRLGKGPDASFVAINCGAIPEGLIESELFGHARGAFSGACSDRRGKIEAAAGGTLLLDEIGDMPKAVQVKLLRTLQERTVTRVGETAAHPVSFRLVAATHHDLRKAVAEGSFREDLYYRICEVEIHLPPLRERGDDVLLLARHFLDRHARRNGRPRLVLSPEAEAALLSHRWPGNIRELEGRTKRGVILAETHVVEPIHLDLAGSQEDPSATLDEVMRNFRLRYVRQVLATHGGNRDRAARALGIGVRSIYRYLEEDDEGGGGGGGGDREL